MLSEKVYHDRDLFAQQIFRRCIALRGQGIKAVCLRGVDIAFVGAKRMVDTHDAHVFRQFAACAGFLAYFAVAPSVRKRDGIAAAIAEEMVAVIHVFNGKFQCCRLTLAIGSTADLKRRTRAHGSKTVAGSIHHNRGVQFLKPFGSQDDHPCDAVSIHDHIGHGCLQINKNAIFHT